MFAMERGFSELNFAEKFVQHGFELSLASREFFAWCESLKTLPKSPIGQAVRYALDQQVWLANVPLDGRTELSNNRAERSVKPFVPLL
jgi:hypothetical protein